MWAVHLSTENMGPSSNINILALIFSLQDPVFRVWKHGSERKSGHREIKNSFLRSVAGKIIVFAIQHLQNSVH